MAMQLFAIDDSDNQYALDIVKGSPVTADFNFKDIKDLQAKGSHTYTFRLPSTVANEKYFGHYFMVGSYFGGSGSFNPFARREAYLLQDTIEVFRGYIQLKNVFLREGNKYEYECILFSGEINFLDALKGVKFNQLNFSEISHEPNATNVYNSWVLENIDGGNLIWSLWDYGQGFASTDASVGYDNWFDNIGGGAFGFDAFPIDINKLRPQVRVKYLIDKLMEYAGYTITSTFLDSAYFSKVYCDLNYNPSAPISATIPAQDYYVQATNTVNQIITTGESTFDSVLVADTEISDASNSLSQVSQAGFNYTKWEPQRNGWYTITMKGTLSFSTAQTTGNMGFAIFKEPDFTTYPYSHQIVSNGYQTGVQVAGELVFSTTIAISPDDVGDEYFFAWRNYTTDEIDVTIANFNVTIQPNFTSDTTDTFYAPSLFGNLSCIEWMKGIMSKFNLVVVPNKNDSKNLLIEPYEDFADSGDTKDWSDKIDFNKDVQIIPPTKYCGKKVIFRDSQVGDYVSETLGYNDINEFGYGSYIEPGIQNQFAEKNTEFKTIFSPTINYPLNGMSFDLDFYTCARFGLEDGVKKNVGGMCLSYYHGYHTIPSSKCFRFSGSAVDRVLIPYFSEYDKKNIAEATSNTAHSLNWHTGVVVSPATWDAVVFKGSVIKYWRRYLLDNFNINSRMLSCHMRLTPKDISDFSFSDIITINGQNYRVNSIKGYPISSTGICKVELLATFDSINTPIIVGNDSTYNTDPDGDVIECDVTPLSFSSETGIGSFVTLTDGTGTAITQDCCVALGYYWNTDNNKCYNALPDDNDSTPPTGDGVIGSDGNTDEDDNTVIGGAGGNPTTGNTDGSGGVIVVINHSHIDGTHNILVHPDKVKIDGDDNEIDDKGRGINIGGNRNKITGGRVSNSNVLGDDNEVRAFQVASEIFGEQISFETELSDIKVTGSNARALINGDRVVSTESSTAVKGASQIGEFVIEFNTDGDTRETTIGQFGAFTFTDDNYNNIANKNAIRFPAKTNIKITTELIGVSQTPVNDNFVDKVYLKNTYILTNYVQPITLYSNVDESEITSGMGVFTLEPYTILKMPYGRDIYSGGIAFMLTIPTYREPVDWSLKVTYETTPLVGVQSTTLNPTLITGCELWLDACNESSVIIDSSNRVEAWNDISGGTNHILQSNNTFKPTYEKDFWQRPYLDFDGTSAVLTSTDSDLTGLFNDNNTFFVVYKSDVTTAEYYGQILVGGTSGSSYVVRTGLRINANGGTGAGGSDSLTYSNQTSSTNFNACNIASAGVTNLSIAVGRKSGSDVKVLDGNGNSDTDTTGVNVSTISRFCVGGATYTGTTDLYEFNGRMYELIAYNKALSDADVNAIINYLKNKWNIV